MLKRHHTLIKRLAIIGAVLASLATAGGAVGRLYWVFDLASHFQMQYLLILLVCCLILAFMQVYRWTVVGLIFMSINISMVAPLYMNNRTSAHMGEDGTTIRVLFTNTLYKNREIALTKSLIEEEDPDIVVLAETSQPVVDYLRQSMPVYTSSHFQDGRGVFGIAMLSKFPETAPIEVTYFSTRYIATLIGHYDVNGTEITLIGTHPYPPINIEGAISRNEDLKSLSTRIATIETPLIIVGDLNTTSWSPYFQEFKKSGNLKDSREGFGVQPSWPTYVPSALRIPIDHALVSQDITVLQRRLAKDIHSDHLPIVVDLSIPTKSLPKHSNIESFKKVFWKNA